MPDANLKHLFHLDGGLDAVTVETDIADNEASAVNNMVFWNKKMTGRPLAAAFANFFTPIAEKLVYVEFAADGGVSTGTVTGVAIGNSGATYFKLGNSAWGTVGPVVATYADKLHNNFAVVNGAKLVANSSTGLLRFVGGADSTLIADAPYRYVIGHLQRAVAAYKYPGTGNNTVTVAWSVQGNETDWTSTTLGAGSSVLSDSSDEITGLAVLQNVIIVFHKTMIHIGTPTGQANPAYTFSTWSRDKLAGIGCMYPQSLVVSNNVAYFLGVDNVYEFDLQELNPIGDKVKDLIFSRNPGLYAMKGSISTLGWSGAGGVYPGPVNKRLYHLAPIAAPAQTPHWHYNLEEKSWSKSSYSVNIQYPCRHLGLGASGIGTGADWVIQDDAFAFVDDSATPQLYVWKNINLAEQAQVFFSKTFLIGDVSCDYVLERSYIIIRDTNAGNGLPVTLTVDCILNGAVNTISATVNVGGAADNKLKRYWFNMRLVGNLFRWSISIPDYVTAGVVLGTDVVAIGAQFQESSEFRV